MPNSQNESDNSTENSKINWFIWFFPLIAIGICVWLGINYFQSRGPQITISFEEGSNLQADKTKIRFRGVDIGSVTKVIISEDKKEVIAYATLQKEAARFAVEGSQFWIVSPKVSFQGISGLETLIEGSYISVQPGKEDNEIIKEFKGRMSSESSESLEDTMTYYLETPRADALNAGDKITFRGLKIGSVYKVDLAKTAQYIRAHIVIEKKYGRLIRTNTAFWKKNAVSAKLGLFNSSLKIESLETLLHGGIECFTPDQAGPVAKWGTVFQYYQSPPKDSEKWNPKLDNK